MQRIGISPCLPLALPGDVLNLCLGAGAGRGQRGVKVGGDMTLATFWSVIGQVVLRRGAEIVVVVPKRDAEVDSD